MSDEKTPMGPGAAPFHLGRHCTEVGAELGRLHEARHADTGAAALVLMAEDRIDWELEEPWKVSLSCQREPACVMLEVEQAPASGQVTKLADILVLMTAAIERVEDSAQVNAHLTGGARTPPKPQENRTRQLLHSWRVGALAGLAVLLTLGGGLWWYRASAPERAEPRPQAAVPAPAFRSQVDAPYMTDSDGVGPLAIAYPLPSLPFRNQAIAPCRPERGEVEINGGCWMELAKLPPCLEVQAEYKGKCYLPVSINRGRLPQSIQP